MLKRNRSTRRTSSLWHRFVHSACARRAPISAWSALGTVGSHDGARFGTRRPRLTSLPIQIVGRDARNTRARGATFGSLKRAKYGDRAFAVTRAFRASDHRRCAQSEVPVAAYRGIEPFAGTQVAILEGDPSKPGPYTVRSKFLMGANSVRIHTPTSNTLPSSRHLAGWPRRYDGRIANEGAGRRQLRRHPEPPAPLRNG